MGKYDYVTVYNVDTTIDVDVRIDDVLKELTDENLIEELRERGVGVNHSTLKDNGIPWSMIDDLKFDVIKEAFNKYTLEELEQKLK